MNPSNCLLCDGSLRPAIPEDLQAICVLHEESVRSLCADHYPPEQIGAWIGHMSREFWDAMIQQGLLVIEYQGRLAGMAHLDDGKGTLRALFVHPDFSRRKIGSELMMILESEAYAARQPRLTAYVPFNAVPFFRSQEFIELGPDVLPLPNGITIPCIRMDKACYESLEFSADAPIGTCVEAALKCEDRTIMLATLRKLREQAPRQVLDHLVSQLRHPDPKLRQCAAAGLVVFSKLNGGEVTVEAKMADLAEYLLSGEDDRVRLSCAIHLMPLRYELVDRTYIQALNDTSEKIVQVACSELGYRVNADTTTALYRVLDHPAWRVRLIACIALINQKKADNRVVALLERMGKDPEAAAYDQEWMEMKDFHENMAKVFNPDGNLGEAWDNFHKILTKAREVAEAHR